MVEDLGERGKLGSEGEYRWGGAFHTTDWVDPKEEMSVAFFTQLRPTGELDDQEKLRALVYKALIESPCCGGGADTETAVATD